MTEISLIVTFKQPIQLNSYTLRYILKKLLNVLSYDKQDNGRLKEGMWLRGIRQMVLFNFDFFSWIR